MKEKLVEAMRKSVIALAETCGYLNKETGTLYLSEKHFASVADYEYIVAYFRCKQGVVMFAAGVEKGYRYVKFDLTQLLTE